MKSFTEKPPAATRFLLLFLVGLAALTAAAGPADSLQIRGNVRDIASYEYLWDVRVELLAAADSSVVLSDTCRNYSLLRISDAEERRLRYKYVPEKDYIYYSMRIPHGRHLLRFSRKGYAPLVVPLDIPARQYGREVKAWTVDDALMQRAGARELGEAVVTATRVMMVHKGDTVVFNADYFQLAEGNMLDRLVAMLPGLEIRPGGQILYNGNSLSTLLVNGKDFFNGDASVALQNLPAYMVRNVKVYHKEADDAYLHVHKDSTRLKTPNTLDVVLKREYSHGWIANADLAGGPTLGGDAGGDRFKYMARLFGLYFDKRSRLGVVGNFNNVSDTQVADEHGDWSSGWRPPEGVLRLQYGALTYSTELKRHNLKYHANLKATREITDSETRTANTTFLSSGDVYRRTADKNRDEVKHLVMNHNLVWPGKTVYLSVFTGADYFDRLNRGHSLSAQFGADPADARRCASLDSVFYGPDSPRLRKILTNRLEQTALGRGTDWAQINRINLTFRSPLLGNAVYMMGYTNYSRNSFERFQHYDLRYAGTGTGDYRNRYFDTPSHAFRATALAGYDFANMMSAGLNRIFGAKLTYNYNRSSRTDDTGLYNLHELDDGDAPAGDLPLGMLPSTQGWRELTLDAGNSYHRKSREDDHRLSPEIRIGAYRGAWGYLSLSTDLTVRRERLSDTRSAQRADRRLTLFAPAVGWEIQWAKKHGDAGQTDHRLNANYRQTDNPAPMGYLLDIRNDTDPLHVSLGNPGLRTARSHSFRLFYYTRLPSKANVSATGYYSRTKDAVATGYSYDTQTGVYTYRPENVDGNWQAGLSVHCTFPLDKAQKWNLSSDTDWSHNHSVDLMNGARSTVRNHSTREGLTLYCRLGKHGTLSVRGQVKWQYATSERENYRTRSTWDLGYGPQLSLKLPADLSLSTKFTVYQRRGYDDRAMNDNDLVWNASLDWNFDLRRSSYRGYTCDGWLRTKTQGTGARPWTLRLEAHDLLRQLSNTWRTVNAQGITETWYNAVPAYVMLHIAYRFTRAPKGQGAPQP